MNTAVSNSVTSCPVPEFDVAVLGRSFAAQRVAARLRTEVGLSVHEIDDVTAARYDDIDNRWEILLGRDVVARAKFTVDGDGDVELRNGDEVPGDRAMTSHGFPNLFRPVHTSDADAVGYTVSCIAYMRENGFDYAERRLRTPIADDEFPELSFDRPTPTMWCG